MNSNKKKRKKERKNVGRADCDKQLRGGAYKQPCSELSILLEPMVLLGSEGIVKRLKMSTDGTIFVDPKICKGSRSQRKHGIYEPCFQRKHGIYGPP